MVRKRSKLSRAAAMLLSVVMILSCFVIIPATDVGAVDLTEEETGIKFVKTVTFEEPYTGNSYTYYKGRDRQRMYVYENNVKKNAYCIQPGTTTGDMTKGQRSAWDALGRDKQRAIALAMYYGFIDSSTTHNSEMYPSGRNFTDNQRWVATQLIIWDLVCGYRDADDYKLNDDRWINSICGDNWITNNPEYNWQVAWCYKAIANKMIEHKTIMSFTARRSTIAPTYTMKWNGSAYSVTLTDTNNVLKNYSLKDNPNSNIKLSASSNKLTVTSSKPVTSAATVSYQTTVYGNDPVAKVVCYGSGYASVQDVVLATDAVPDPVTAYFKLITEPVGSLKVTKTYSDVPSVGNFIVNNTKFTVKNAGGQYVKASKSGSNYTFTGTTTDKSKATLFHPAKNGNTYSFSVGDLPHGKYTVTEDNNSDQTGFKAESTSKNVTVSNTQAVAEFTNSPIDIVIVKQFDIYGDLSDEDYSNVTLQVMDSRDSKPIVAIPIDTENNIYQYIDKSNRESFADNTTDLKFINPKNHKIIVRGLPQNNNYTVVERNVDTNRFRVEYENAEITDFKSNEFVFVTNTEKANGQITITKDFLSDDGNGNRTQYNDNSVYEHLSFTIKNAAGKYITAANNGNNNYSYSGLSSEKNDTTSFVIAPSAGKSFTVNDLPYGKYTVTEVMDRELRAVKGFTVDGTGTRTTELTNTSPSATINYTNATINNTSLFIKKTFVNSAGEETDVEDELYNNISFTVSGTRLQLKDSASGIYEVWTDGDIVREMKLGTESKTITVKNLPAGDYTITENISDSIADMVIANSTFTVYHLDGETDTIAADNATAQSRTVRINDNGQTNIEFINTFVTDKLNIVKESEDGLKARKFSIVTLNSSLYPEASPLYVTTDETGNATIEDLPVYTYNKGAVEKVKYRVTEVDVLDVYKVISSQDIELVPGSTANRLTFVNELKRGSITVVKIAEQEGSTVTAPLAGVEFTLTNDLDDTVLRGRTDNDGKLVFADLVAGAVVNNNVVPITYTLHEVSGKANNSFTLASDSIFHPLLRYGQMEIYTFCCNAPLPSPHCLQNKGLCNTRSRNI